MRAGILAVVLPLVGAKALAAGSPSRKTTMHRYSGTCDCPSGRLLVGSIEPWQADRLPMVREHAPTTR
jgi:hypothetical protein